uniref:Uncharacterized protein n=1 Tax=Globodera rostochiensis TaxID=31243 RepID=A0A914GQW6_GLORO
MLCQIDRRFYIVEFLVPPGQQDVDNVWGRNQYLLDEGLLVEAATSLGVLWMVISERAYQVLPITDDHPHPRRVLVLEMARKILLVLEGDGDETFSVCGYDEEQRMRVPLNVALPLIWQPNVEHGDYNDAYSPNNNDIILESDNNDVTGQRPVHQYPPPSSSSLSVRTSPSPSDRSSLSVSLPPTPQPTTSEFHTPTPVLPPSALIALSGAAATPPAQPHPAPVFIQQIYNIHLPPVLPRPPISQFLTTPLSAFRPFRALTGSTAATAVARPSTRLFCGDVDHLRKRGVPKHVRQLWQKLDPSARNRADEELHGPNRPMSVASTSSDASSSSRGTTTTQKDLRKLSIIRKLSFRCPTAEFVPREEDEASDDVDATGIGRMDRNFLRQFIYRQFSAAISMIYQNDVECYKLEEQNTEKYYLRYLLLNVSDGPATQLQKGRTLHNRH